MLVKPEIMVILSNHEFFVRYCFNTDLCRINRMWEKHLDKTISGFTRISVRQSGMLQQQNKTPEIFGGKEE